MYGAGNTPRILALDCGMKANIVRYFVYVKKKRREESTPSTPVCFCVCGVRVARLRGGAQCCILIHLYVTLLVPLHSSSSSSSHSLLLSFLLSFSPSSFLLPFSPFLLSSPRYVKKVELTVVPFDFDVSSVGADYDGLFLSNGPGDPTMVRGVKRLFMGVTRLFTSLPIQRPR